MMLFGGKDEEKKPVKKEQTAKTAAPKAFSNDGLMGKGTGGYDVLIGKNTVINGNISVQGCTRIDGYIEGTLAVDNMLHIGESGVVKAPIYARDAVIAGTVFGNIVCKGRLQLTTTAKVTGNLKCSSLSIPDGAYFRGSSSGFDDQGTLPEGTPQVIKEPEA